MWNYAFEECNVQDYLQGDTVDVAGTLVAISSTDGVLKSMRADENEINDKIEAAIIVVRNLGTEPLTDFCRLHRLRRPSRRLDDNPSTATPVLKGLVSHIVLRAQSSAGGHFTSQLQSKVFLSRRILKSSFANPCCF